MNWVLPLVGCGGPAGCQCGHETRRHRVLAALFASVFASVLLAACGGGSGGNLTTSSEREPGPPGPGRSTTIGSGDGDGEKNVRTVEEETNNNPPPNDPPPNDNPPPDNDDGLGGGTNVRTVEEETNNNPPPNDNPPNDNPPVSRSVNLPNNPPPQRGITRSGFDSIEVHSHIKDELFPKPFWQLDDYFLDFYYNIRKQDDRRDVHDYSGRIRLGNHVFLTEDTNTKVPDNYGWQGKRLTHGNIEAYVFTKKAGGFTSGTKFKDEYSLNSNGEFTNLQSGQTSGWERIRLHETAIQLLNKDTQFTYSTSQFSYTFFINEFAGTSNSQGTFKVFGSYDGVPGYFKCYSNSVQTCTIGIRNERTINGETVDDYQFGTIDTNRAYRIAVGGENENWRFEPINPSQIIPGSIEDHTRHYNYGWWLNKDNWSSFAHYYPHGYNEASINEPVDPSGETGTATYVGGAGGYYAFVHGVKGVLNGYPFDAREPGISGEFRAKARLEVNFTNNTMSGKIFNFTNPDGTPIRNNNDGVPVKDWTVELLNGSYDLDALGVEGNKTKWYDGEHLIEGDGKWRGHYYENTSIFMGQFLASRGTIGKMIGSFGTNRQ